ncbi:MAG: ribulose-phosphate 3-epimerase [Erysipelotrichaceae bacterium]|nr:ribulose-phosphate 3-epimerase [Erysipelotrichaceae bacterium]
MKISVSVLSLDYSDTKKQLDEIKKHLNYMHFDVMDAHFVPNLTFGPKILSDFKRYTGMITDVHIMVDNPRFVSEMVANDADITTFHYEAMEDESDIIPMIEYLHSKKVKAGIAVNPGTNVTVLLPYLHVADLVLVMSVEPGFGGQSFIESSYAKIEYLKEYREKNNLNYLIEVDGGVNDTNSHKLIESGADILVSGSFLLKGDLKENIDKLL